MNLMYISLSVIVGFVLGVVVAFIVITRFSSKHKIQDELTRSKRELANAKRLLDEFFVNSSELFSQVTKSYVSYASFMANAAAKLSPDNQDLFNLDLKEAQKLAKGAQDSKDGSKQSLKESLKALQEQVSDITASIEEEEKKDEKQKAQESAPSEESKEQSKEASDKAPAKEEEKKSVVEVKEKEEIIIKDEKPQVKEPTLAPKAEESVPKTKVEPMPDLKSSTQESVEDLPQPPKDFVESKEPQKI